MKLEINKNHTKINLEKLNKPLKKAKIAVLGLMITASIYTGGLAPDEVYAETYNEDYQAESETSDYSYIIPDCYQNAVCIACGKNSISSVTSSDIQNIYRLELDIYGEESLDFLDRFSNLSDLCLNFCYSNDEYCLDTIPSIPSLEKLTITANEDIEISESVNNGFITNNLDNIKELDLEGISIGPNAIEKFNNLNKLKIGISENNEIDYSNLNVEVLDLSWYGPYDIPIFLNKTSYESLKSNGTTINFANYGDEEQYEENLNKIDNIVTSLGINENSSDQEKLDKIIYYCLDNLQYDSEVQNAVNNNGNVGNLISSKGFYDNGNLYACFEKNTQICGNYTGLMKALLKRLDIDNYYLISNVHAWNLVKVDGELYYVDSTILDLLNGEENSQKIKNSDTFDLDWYMINVDKDSAYSYDSSGDHDPILFPEYLNDSIEETITYEEIPDVTTEETEIKIGDNTRKVLGGSLLGVLTAVGLARRAKRRKRREKIKNVKNGYEDYPYYYEFNAKEYRKKGK